MFAFFCVIAGLFVVGALLFLWACLRIAARNDAAMEAWLQRELRDRMKHPTGSWPSVKRTGR